MSVRKLVLKTERLALVLATPDEASAVVAYLVRNKERFKSTEPPRRPDFYSVNTWKTVLKNSNLDFDEDRSVKFFVELLDEPGRFIGSVNFMHIMRGPFQACMLGYAIDADYEGKGLMAEAVTCGIQYMFDKKHLHRIFANHLPDNHRSAGLLKRLGFRVDGKTDEYLFIDGQWRPHVLNSLVNRDWAPRPEDAELFAL